MRLKLSIPSFEAFFWNSPTGQEALANAEHDALDRRERLVSELESLTAAHDKKTSTLINRQSAAIAKVKAAQSALREANEAYRQAWYAAQSEANVYNQKAGAIQRELQSLVPAVVDEALAEIERQRDGLKIEIRTVNEKDEWGNPVSRRVCNTQNVRQQAEALSAARSELLAARFLPANEVEPAVSRIMASVN